MLLVCYNPFFFFYNTLEAVRSSSNKYVIWPSVSSRMSLSRLLFKLQAEAHRTHMLDWVPHTEKSHCCPLFRISGCPHLGHGTAGLAHAHWWHTRIIVFPEYLVPLTPLVCSFWRCIMKLLTEAVEKPWTARLLLFFCICETEQK